MSVDDYPSHAEVRDALFEFIFRAGPEKALKPLDIYGPLADKFLLTTEQRTRPRNDTAESAWNNRLQWARRRLVDDGLVARKAHGRWTLSEAGWAHGHQKFGAAATGGKLA